MINSPKEVDISTDHEKAKAISSASTSSSSSQWLKLKDPRIVRVSRAFGGKDRHSKVYTIKGLRDRRVRLSVPTAIHLYDLQERLGLNQPSKVVDWLLNAAKHEIDDLPPLPIPPNYNFTLGYPSFVSSNHKEGHVDVAPTKWSLGRVDVRGLIPTSTENISSFGSGNDSIQNNTSICKSKSKQVLDPEEMVSEKENWMNRSEDQVEEDKQGISNSAQHVLPNNLLLRANHHPSFLGLLNTMPLGYQLEPSVDVAAKLGFVNQVVTDHVNGISDVPFPSSLSLSTGSTTTTTPQFLVCPHAGATQPYFLSHVAAMEMDPRQINNYQMMSSNSLNPSQHLMMRNMSTHKLFHSPTESHSHHQDRDFPSK